MQEHNYKMVMNVILQQKMEKIFSMQKIQKKIEVESSKYLKQAATCVTPGIYYKSCTCGAKSNSEFYTGHLGHDYTVKVKKRSLFKIKSKRLYRT